MAVTKRREDWLQVTELDIKSRWEISGVPVLSTAAELNALDGITSTVDELNALDGITSNVGELNILDGVTADKDELNLLDNQIASVTYVIGTEAADVINCGMVMKDAAGVAMATPVSLRWYLSDDSTGLDPATAAPDGGGVIGTDGALIESVANLSGMLVTEANGAIDIDWTDAGTLSKYMVVVLPNGSLAISVVMTWAA